MLVARPVSSNTGAARPGDFLPGPSRGRRSPGLAGLPPGLTGIREPSYRTAQAGIQRHRGPASRCLSLASSSLLVLYRLNPHSSIVIQILLRVPAFLCFAVMLSQCATKPKDTDSSASEKPKKDPVAVGIVEFVNPEQKFVLIKMQSREPMPPGQILTALDATGSLSELSVSPERKGLHLTADIKSGMPRAGNLVIYRAAPEASGNPTPDPLLPLSPLSSSPLPSPTGAQVEWRDGQPPPIQPSGGADLAPNTDGLPIIPLEPLPEEPPRP